MSNRRTIRAWKDEVFRLSLSEAERASLPQNLVGPIELSDAETGPSAAGPSSRSKPALCSAPQPRFARRVRTAGSNRGFLTKGVEAPGSKLEATQVRPAAGELQPSPQTTR